MKPSPTLYSDVNEVLDLLYSNIKNILQDQFVGMYLFGSLANGDFDKYSDIDILIVTDGEISESAFSVLKDMHLEMAKMDSHWALQQEISYIPKNALRRFDSSNKLHPHLDRGDGEVLHLMAHESDWIIQRDILRQRGVVVAGPDIKSLIDPVPPEDLRRAVVEVLPLWIDPILENPTKIRRRGYQSYCVLSLCRMLYTLQNKSILSKPAAAKWAMEALDAKWRPLIERAVIGRQNPNQDAEQEDIQGTLDMMRYVFECTQQPSIFPDVNEILSLLHKNAKEVLGVQFTGLYLYGSLSSGDFNPKTSDIDFLFVTKDSLSDETISQLGALHKQTWATASKRASKLEGAYVPKALIRRHDPDGPPCPTLNEGRFYMAPLGSDWIIQRHIVREYGVVIEGPGPGTLIDFVSPDEIRGAVIGTLREWWFPMLDDPSWIRDGESGYRAFAVITMCRVLHALEHGRIISKPKAIDWARMKLAGPWKGLIDKAKAASNHEEQDLPLDETLNFIRYTREQVK